jgi:hypothetical protein
MRRVPALLLLFFSSCPVVLSAQSTDGSIIGRVTDSRNAVIADAKVASINAGTDVRYEAPTNASGEYCLTNLPSGGYRIEIEKTDFQKLVKPGVELHVSDVISLNFSLQDDSAAQSVTVEGGEPLAETKSGEISPLVNRKRIEALPLNGRNCIDLSLLQAGVTNSLNSTGTTGFGGTTGTDCRVKTKAEMSVECNKSGTVKIQAGRFVCIATLRSQERNLLQTARPATQNHCSLLSNLQGPAPLHRS